VFLAVFLDMIGFGILIPIQPFYAEMYGARPATVTLLSACFSLVQFLFAPFLGRVSDSVGRRPIMLLTIAVNAVGYALFGLAQSLPMLFAARMISGFGSANLGTAQAIIADTTTAEGRAKGMGLLGAAFGLGFIFGPAIGGFCGQYGLAVPAFVAAAFSTVNLIFAYLKLPETRPREADAGQARPAGAHKAFLGLSPEALREALKLRNVPQILWLYLIGTLAFSQMEQVLGLFIEHVWIAPQGSAAEQLRRAAALTSYFLVVVGITATIVQGALIGWLARRFGERRLILVGTVLLAVSLGALPLVGSLGDFGLFLGLAPVMAFGAGLTNPSLPSLLSQSVEDDAYGGILGLGHSLSALGRVIGPFFAGMLFELEAAVPFWTGAILMTSCTLMALTLRARSADVDAS
jgi:MFS family permease